LDRGKRVGTEGVGGEEGREKKETGGEISPNVISKSRRLRCRVRVHHEHADNDDDDDDVSNSRCFCVKCVSILS